VRTLWFFDLEDRTVQPAAELKDIPQAIEELVVFDGGVAVRCGPNCFALERDLSGDPRDLTLVELAEVQDRARLVDSQEVQDPVLHHRFGNGDTRDLSHSAVHYWGFGMYRLAARPPVGSCTPHRCLVRL